MMYQLKDAELQRAESVATRMRQLQEEIENERKYFATCCHACLRAGASRKDIGEHTDFTPQWIGRILDRTDPS